LRWSPLVDHCELADELKAARPPSAREGSPHQGL